MDVIHANNTFDPSLPSALIGILKEE